MNAAERMAASVRQRLKNSAGGTDFQTVLVRYGLERLLYRLGQSPYRERFVLKGALLFNIWLASSWRATRDADLLGFGDNTPEQIMAIFKELCELPVAVDGLVFAADSVTSSIIKPDQKYQGVRIELLAYLAGTRTKIPLQVDVGFGDAITPEPVEIEFPPMLDLPAPQLLSYPRETVVAEKFQAMVLLGMSNTRLKDFYDLWILATDFSFDGSTLAAALKATFDRRQTRLPQTIDEVVALTEAFAGNPQKQQAWRGFLRKHQLGTELELGVVVKRLDTFLMPVSGAANRGEPFASKWDCVWNAPPWK
jgi:predicted nucleotidyltransferase component of viral defense system